jgi:hypothetical protein
MADQNNQYSKLHLEFSNDGTLQLQTDGVISLQKQIRGLKQELSSPVWNDAQRQQIRLALAETQMGMERTKAQSKELFGQLALLPGPVGDFSAKVQGALIAFRTLSQLSFKDIATDFQIIARSLGGVTDATTIVDKNTKEVIQGGTGNAVGQGAIQATEAGTAATISSTIAVKANTAAKQENILSDELAALKGKDLAKTYATLEEVLQADIVVTNKKIAGENVQIVTATALDGTVIELTKDEALLTIQNATLTASTSTLTIATDFLIASLKALLTTIIAIGGAVGIAWLLTKMADWAEAYKKTTKEGKLLNQELERQIALGKKTADIDGENIGRLENMVKLVNAGNLTQREKNSLVNEYNDKLGDTLGKVKSWGELEDKLKKDGPDYITYLQTKAKANAAYALSIEATKKAIEEGAKDPAEFANFWDKLSGLIESKDYGKTIRLQGEVNRGIRVDELNKDKDAYFKIFQDTQKEADKLADKLKIPAVKIKGLETPKKPKELQDKELLEKEKELQDELIALDKESERERQLFELKVQQDKEEFAIKSLHISKKLEGMRSVALLEIQDKYGLKSKVLKEKWAEEDAKALREFNKKRDKILSDQETNELERQVQQIKDKHDEDLAALEADKEFIKLSFQEQEEIRTALLNKANADEKDLRKKHDIEILKTQADNLINGNNKEKTLLKDQITNKYNILYAALIKEHDLEIKNKKLTEEEKKAIELKYSKSKRDLRLQELAERQQVEQKYVELARITGSAISSLGDALMQENQGRNKAKFEDAKKYAVAGIWLEKAAALGSIYMNTQKAMAEDMGKFGVFGIPLTAIDLGIGIAQAAATIIAGATAASQINGTDFQPAAAPNMGKNYGAGGMIDGPSHSQGGVPITAEGGEAVMTRGSVTMFQPLLSMMNQMGGGTAFSGGVSGQAKWDNPKSPGSPTEPQIIKTYVVQSDLTNAQQRHARLKSLSTL